MPQIIVMADGSTGQHDEIVMFRERVNVSDFESRHFGSQLLERLGWAVGDAHELEIEQDEKLEIEQDEKLEIEQDDKQIEPTPV